MCRESGPVCIFNRTQLLLSSLCSSFAPHSDPSHGLSQCWLPALPPPEPSTSPLVSLSPRPPLSHSILSNLWTTGFTSQHSGGLEVQDQGASRLNIWRGLPSAAASSGGRDTEALWGSSPKEGFRAHLNIFIGSFMRIKPLWSNHF